MNLCIVIPWEVGVSETFIKSHINAFSAHILNSDAFPNKGSRNDLPKFSNSAIWYKDKLKNLIRRFAIGPLEEQLKERFVSKFFKKNNIDVVLTEYGLAGAAAIDFCRKYNIPLVVHFHGMDAYMKREIDRWAKEYQKLFSYAEAIIAVSRDMKSKLIKLGAPSDKIFYIVYGVNINDFNQAKPGNAAPLLLGVGRFVEKKAPYLTILAFQKVLEKIPEAKLILIGDGMLRDVCRKMIDALNLSHAIDLKGEVSHEQIPLFMQRSRAFVQHSLVPESGDSEGTPVSILEAGASGLPVISTYHAGIPDVVIDRETGFLVKEGDIDGMAHYMHKLLINPDLADEMGGKARKHIEENYTTNQSINNLRSILENSRKKNQF